MGFRTLAGAAGDGFPLGTIVALYSHTVPTGFLPCNGTQFDIHQYPALYTLLGRDTTPDLRECGLVGAGQSGRVISAHDIYTIGQFKDDQVQTIGATIDTSGIEITVTDPGHTHTISSSASSGSIAVGDIYDGQGTAVWKGAVDAGDTNPVTLSGGSATVDSATTGITAAITDGSVTATFEEYRNGATTHGKQVGVNYVIKATTGATTVTDPEIYEQIIAFIEANYVKDDKEHFSEGDLIKYDATNDKFVSVGQGTVNGQVLSYVPGSSTTTYHDAWTNGTDFYEEDMTPTVEPEGTAGTPVTLGTATVYNGSYYYHNPGDSNWYPITGFTKTPAPMFTLGAQVTDTDVIDALDASTDTVTFSYVEYTETVTTAPDYQWVRNGSTTTHIFNTQAAYDAALLIPEGQNGFIADGDIVVKNWLTDVVKGVDKE